MSTLTPSRFGALEGDVEPLYLPMPGLLADLEAGAGAIALTDEFLESPAQLRLQVLQKWLRALSAQRDAAVVDLFREFAPSLRGLTIVEQIERFRHLCADKGMACPADLPLLLQRF